MTHENQAPPRSPSSLPLFRSILTLQHAFSTFVDCHCLSLSLFSLSVSHPPPPSSFSQNNHPAVVKAIIETGTADVNQAMNNGVTPLITAAGKNHVEIVKNLVEEGGADVNQAMDDGFTPAFVA